MTIVLAEHSDVPVDVLKVLKMVLIHDIVEIDAGDTFIYDTQKSHSNTENELIAAKRIFGLLPDEQAEELIAIWQEFEAGETPEARFAKAMDRIEPLLQNTSNNGGTWREFDVDYSKVFEKKKVIAQGSATLWKFAENLLNESVEKGILKKTDWIWIIFISTNTNLKEIILIYFDWFLLIVKTIIIFDTNFKLSNQKYELWK